MPVAVATNSPLRVVPATSIATDLNGCPAKRCAKYGVQPPATSKPQLDGTSGATATGIEGSLVYAVSADLREQIAARGEALLHLDLLPDRSAERVRAEVAHPRGSRSLASHLKGRLGLDGIKLALLHEVLGREALHDAGRLAHAIKALPLRLSATRPIEEAISSAGGVRWDAMDEGLMLRTRPGVWCAGEMLDWEAPTGGYLLTASMASGRAAGEGVLRHLESVRCPA